jgi:hypothetical protein
MANVHKKLARVEGATEQVWSVHFLAQQILRRRRAMDYKRMVEDGGGIYKGEMKHEAANLHLVLFDGPHNGSTMALYVKDMTGPDAVRQHIEEQKQKFLSFLRAQPEDELERARR